MVVQDSGVQWYGVVVTAPGVERCDADPVVLVLPPAVVVLQGADPSNAVLVGGA